MNRNKIIVIALLVAAYGCQRQEVAARKYREINIKPATSAMPKMPALAAAPSSLKVSWTTPQGWEELKGEGMRMVTFKSTSDGLTECSIISLSGVAGGLEANIIRWMNQVAITPLEEDELKKFLDQQKHLSTQTGQGVLVIDFSVLQGSLQNSTPSILGAVVTFSDETLFIKMTGTKEALFAQRENFEKLCQSLNIPQ